MYNEIELMICVASRLLEDGATVGVGTGAPCAAAMLAQKTHAPGLLVAFEAGGLAPMLPAMPISVGDSRTTHRALMATSMCDIMESCQRGVMDYAFLGGAQIDAYGNLNSTVIAITKNRVCVFRVAEVPMILRVFAGVRWLLHSTIAAVLWKRSIF